MLSYKQIHNYSSHRPSIIITIVVAANVFITSTPPHISIIIVIVIYHHHYHFSLLHHHHFYHSSQPLPPAHVMTIFSTELCNRYHHFMTYDHPYSPLLTLFYSHQYDYQHCFYGYHISNTWYPFSISIPSLPFF